jgi:acetylornithine aminotransferase
MALRISAKRVAASLKASNMSTSVNGILTRNASQATAAAAASNLSEGARNEIHVSISGL